MRQPIVLVPACSARLGSHPYHTVQFKYVDAVARAARCSPLILPALGDATDLDTVLGAAHGVMLTGSPSNVDPSHYGQPVHDASLPRDPARDATTLPLVKAAIERGIPLLALCRGFQEVNVALGGTLHQAVQEVPGFADHREDTAAPLDRQYGPAHQVELASGGLLAGIMQAGRITVNSLHGQGIARLAPMLVPEAVAPDGLVEAFSCPSAPGFVLGVQWHPEWKVMENADSLKLFAAFGEACRQYQNMLPLREP
ncbi:MAG TPA: gamma-glutamyl-gamma-aminobutyrate hydrolase family protein [Telluria sp.]|nr:gamma-glutamyl-gamma-aminobutyrate hydrolase family protein [Telluria sp.]